MLYQPELETETISISELTVMRAEKGGQNPTVKNIKKITGALEMPHNSFFCPALDNLTTEMLMMNGKIGFYALLANEDKGYLEQGFELLGQMRNSGNYDIGVNLQLLLNYEVALKNLSFADPESVRETAMQAIKITYPELWQSLKNSK